MCKAYATMNTVDPAVPYGKPKEEQRAPMLSDAIIGRYVATTPFMADENTAMELDDAAETGAYWARHFYEAKITSGELRVVKKATNEHEANHINARTFYCSNCHTHTERVFRYAAPGSPRTVKFCPGCGAQIVKSLTLDESSSKLSDVQRGE